MKLQKSPSLWFVVCLLVIAIQYSQGEKLKEHHEDAEGHHEGKVHKGYKAYYHEKKMKEMHHHKTYGHDDKHFHKGIKSPSKHALEVPPHEAHLQGDLKAPKGYKGRPNHESWHKKDMHLQDLSFNGHKSHHGTHSPRAHVPSKPHHQTLQHDQPAVASHHKGPSSEERGFLHRPRKVTPSSPSVHGDKSHHHLQKSAKPLTKSFHPEREIKHPVQEPAKKSSHHKEKPEHPSWSKNKKQKKAFEKKIKQKQHRKKQFKGELHKLW